MTENDRLPPTWCAAPLSVLALINPPKGEIDVGQHLLAHFVPMARVAEEFGGIDVTTVRPINEVIKGYTAFREGDVLYAKITPCMENGKIGVVPALEHKLGFGSTEFHVLRTTDLTLAKWIAHYLSQAGIRRDAQRSMTGSAGQLRVPSLWLTDRGLPVPPLEEQRRIVAKIEELFSDLDAGVAALERAKANLKRYRAAVLKAAVEGKLTEAWRAEHPNAEPAAKLLERILTERRKKWEADQLAKFAAANKQPPKNWREKYVEPVAPDTSGLPELPKGWVWTSMEAVIREPLRNGHSARASTDENGIRTLTLTAVTYGEFSERNTKFTVADPEVVSDLWIEPGDIFIERSNTPELVGTARLYMGPSRFAVFPDLLIRIRPTHLACMDFVDICLQSRRIRQFFCLNAKGLAGSMPKIDQSTILRCVLPLPPFEEQVRIVSEVVERLSQIDAAEQAINHGLMRAARLRQSILKDAFEGKLVAQDARDEPASILLARIQAQRNVAATAAASRSRKPPKVPREIFLRRAAVVSYTVERLAARPSFGRTQLEKTLHLAQCHLGIEMGFHFERYAAGPFDKDIYRLEGTAKKKDWFTTQQRPNFGVTYHPGTRIGDMCRQATGYLGAKRAELDRLLDHIAVMNTDEAELFATAYAAWNDLLLAGKPAEDEAIIRAIHEWDPSKRRFSPKRILERLAWMRHNGYRPTGSGTPTMPRRPRVPKEAKAAGAGAQAAKGRRRRPGR